MRASKRFEGTRPAIPCASEDGPAGHPSRLPFGAPERDLDGARPAGQEPDLTTGNGRLCSGGREKDLRSRGNEKSVPLGAIPTKIEPVICPTKNSSAPPKLFTMSWQRFVHHVLELDTRGVRHVVASRIDGLIFIPRLRPMRTLWAWAPHASACGSVSSRRDCAAGSRDWAVGRNRSAVGGWFG